MESRKALSTTLIVILLIVPTLASPVSAWLVGSDPLSSSLASIHGCPSTQEPAIKR